MAKGKTKVADLGPLDLKTLNGMLRESTVAKIKIQYFKEQLKDIADRAKEDLDISTSEFNKYANIAFENHKAQEALDKAEEVYENAVRLGLITDQSQYNAIQRQAYDEMDRDNLTDDLSEQAESMDVGNTV